MVNGVHNDVGDIIYTTVVRVVGEVVKMKEPVKEVAADAELGITGMGVTQGCESSGLKAPKGTTSSVIKVGVTVEDPLR